MLLLRLVFSALCLCQAAVSGLAAKHPVSVVVAGAGSKLGSAVFSRLLKLSHFQPVGIVSDNREAKQLKALGAKEDQVKVVDFAQAGSWHRVGEMLQQGGKVVICSSASPKRTLTYQIANALRSLVGKGRPPKPNELFYPRGRSPKDIDYGANRRLVDLCASHKVDQVVFMATMGGYRGKASEALKWRRALERHMMERVKYTIIHTGKLSAEPGGEKEVVWDTDDALLVAGLKTIPIDDAAEVAVEALRHAESINRSIDVASGPHKWKPGHPTGEDWRRFWSDQGNCLYPCDTPNDHR